MDDLRVDGLVDLVARAWRDLTPPLDDSSLRLLKAFIQASEPISLYKASRSAGLSLSLAYRKGRSLESLRLIQQVGGKLYTATIKGCIAALVGGIIGHLEFTECTRRKWPLEVLGITMEEALSMMYALGVVIRRRGLDLTKATICNYDEASLHVFKVYLASIVARVNLDSDVRGALKSVAYGWGVDERIVAAAFRAAVKGVLSVIPPTIATPKHRILAIVDSGSPRVVAVYCKAARCRYYEEELGLTCPAIALEIASKLRCLEAE